MNPSAAMKEVHCVSSFLEFPALLNNCSVLCFLSAAQVYGQRVFSLSRVVTAPVEAESRPTSEDFKLFLT